MTAKWGRKGKQVVGGAAKTTAGAPERITNKLDHTLVAESKPQRWARVKTALRKIGSHRRFKPAAIVLVVVVVASGAALYLGRGKEVPAAIPEGPKCSYAILEKAKPNLDAKNVEKLEAQVRDIEKIPGYDQDPNCLFVTLTYYINLGDPGKAREDYDKLVKTYSPGEGYETIISDIAKKPADYKMSVEFLEQQAKVYQNVGPDGAPR